MSKFITVKLNELAAPGRSVISGPFGSNIGQRFFKTHGVPIIRGNNLTTDFKKFNDDGFVFLTEEKADELKSDAIKGDILFTAAGTIGQVGMIPQSAKYDRYVISNKQLRFRVDPKKAEPDYVYYWLASPWIYKTIIDRNTGSTVPLINLGIIKSLPVSLPKDIIEQKKIASVLANIDEKIVLNNRINAELEAMAKTLYDYWFVQFDFPDANGKPYKTSGGKMMYNATLKREIPAGWAVNTLSQIANITMGQSPAGESYNEDGIGTLFFQGSTDFGWLFPTPRQYTTSPARMAKKGDILLSVRAPVGDMNIANADCCIGRGLAALNSKSRSDGFLFYVMKYFKQVFDRRNAEGTTFGSMTKDDLHSLQVVCPDPGLLKRYDDIVSEYNKMIFTRSLENQALIKLRDWLLPLLMNGQITVK
ncbi:restriction endonuclease subunit S [Enterobacter ludwigii]|uniref:restriction endonuclease subunit S n=1 Tax=Enterobacter ludwigii TaxID=299767 RepID=UPI00129C4263|nr:restriction endonuclease subunit S [Enterobacter ludwigii]EFB2628484.1 restriction endonuclease subunit S [Escherichia coli]EFB9258460.1 restriction endonuclease subunit S [Escherichia coli]EFN9283440.1 restriction endonuclease subunit S [Escherichia coli]MRI49240.1 restriction endonuclease subunit S [Enterobacter ludwigii]